GTACRVAIRRHGFGRGQHLDWHGVLEGVVFTRERGADLDPGPADGFRTCAKPHLDVPAGPNLHALFTAGRELEYARVERSHRHRRRAGGTQLAADDS